MPLTGIVREDLNLFSAFQSVYFASIFILSRSYHVDLQRVGRYERLAGYALRFLGTDSPSLPLTGTIADNQMGSLVGYTQFIRR